MVENDIYPQYRKYPNDRTFFKITGPAHFVQLDIIGKKYDLHEVHAHQYPERQRIQDMLVSTDVHWIMSTKEEYEARLEYCRKELIPVH